MAHMSIETRIITVAAAQLPARPLEQARQALADIEQAIARASLAGADLVVLPECCYPAYWLGTKDRYLQADVLRGQALVGPLGDLARRHRIAIVAGIVHQRKDGVLHDAAVLADASGRVLGRHDKTFLWDAEHDWYEPGGPVRPVECSLGRVGMLICAEGRSPEVFASHAAQGAALLAMPTAWVNAATGTGEYYNPQPDFLIQARALEFGLPIVCANKFGQECEQARFCGMSLIVAADGEVLAEAPADQPALLVARLRAEPRRLILPEATVKQLLDPREPVLPPADAVPLRVAILGSEPARQSVKQIEALLSGHGVRVMFHLEEDGNVAAPGETGGVWTVHPFSRDSSQVRVVAGARVGLMTDRQARSFVWPRLLALDGAQVLAVVGSDVAVPTLRVRAIENWVFVIAAPGDRPTAIAPSGAIIAEAPAGKEKPLILDLQLREAAGKEVAPRTYVWTERRVGAYRLAAEQAREKDR